MVRVVRCATHNMEEGNSKIVHDVLTRKSCSPRQFGQCAIRILPDEDLSHLIEPKTKTVSITWSQGSQTNLQEKANTKSDRDEEELNRDRPRLENLLAAGTHWTLALNFCDRSTHNHGT